MNLDRENAPPAKADLYRRLNRQLKDLLRGEPDFLANAANTAALIFHELPELNWAGFYLLQGDELVLGPFQGKPACTRIAPGRGACGTAAGQCRSIVVENVHQFPGHIACDPDSRAEIVIPLVKSGQLIGVLDLDSPRPGRFDADDRAGLETLVQTFLASTEYNPMMMRAPPQNST